MKKINFKAFFNLFSPEGKTRKYRTVLFFVSLLTLILAGFALGIMSLYFATGTYKFPLLSFYWQQPKLIFVNVLPFVLLCLLGWFVSNRPWIGFLVSGIVCLAYSFSHYWKLISRDEPLMAEDLSLIREAAQMSEQYAKITWQMYFAVFLVVLGTIIIALFARGKIFNKPLRIATPLISVVVCMILYSTVFTSSTVYWSFEVWSQLNPWFENSNYISRGGIYPFIYSIPNAIKSPPAEYDKEETETQLNTYEYDTIPEDKQVNVMFVMLEAFSDLSKYTDKITSADPYENFHAIQSESYSGELVTNIFAGGTVDTERCVLTGFSNLQSTFRTKSWSYARYFAEMGYSVDGSHAGYKDFYNRYNINRNFGFDNYKFIENHYSQIQDGIPMDNAFMPEITRLFIEQIKSGKKAFAFSVTYQNHGPYEDTIHPDAKEYVPLGRMGTKNYAIANNYLRGVEQTGQYMMDMVNTFRDLEEPVILVFFGDHKPWLGDYSSTYTTLGIDIFKNSNESFYNHYNTEYLIWANNSAKEVLGNDFVGVGPTISPCYLTNVLFEQCGWAGPSYMKLSNEVMKEMPVITTNNRILADGELVTESALSDEQKSLLSDFRKAQYYLAKDAY